MPISPVKLNKNQVRVTTSTPDKVETFFKTQLENRKAKEVAKIAEIQEEIDELNVMLDVFKV